LQTFSGLVTGPSFPVTFPGLIIDLGPITRAGQRRHRPDVPTPPIVVNLDSGAPVSVTTLVCPTFTGPGLPITGHGGGSRSRSALTKSQTDH
jgi:hypothetical protein